MQKKPNFADFISGNGANIAGVEEMRNEQWEAAHGWSKEKRSSQLCVRSRIRQTLSFDLLSIVAPDGRDQTQRLLTSTSRTDM